MDKKKLVIYPFSDSCYPLVEYHNLFLEYELSAVVAPNSWLKTGLDVCNIDDRNESGIFVSDDFEKAVRCADAVLITGKNINEKYRTKVLFHMEQAISWGCDILCALVLTDDEVHKIQLLCASYHTKFMYLCEQTIPLMNQSQEFYIPDVPVIYVGESVEKCHAIDTVVGLTGKFREGGYTVCGIINENFAPIFGMHCMPDFITCTGISERQKVVKLNEFFRYLDQQYAPDVFIVQVPGSMIRFSNRICGDFGVYSYYYFQALEPDFFICTVPFNYAAKSMLEQIKEDLRSHFETEVNIFGISTHSVNFYEPYYEGELPLGSCHYKQVIPIINQLYDYSLPIFCPSRRSDIDQIYSFVLETLSEDDQK